MHILAFISLISPFYLNDFANILVKDWRLWLLIDYAGVKLFPLAVALWMIRSKKMQVAELGFAPQGLLSFLAVFLVVTLVGTVIDQNGNALIAGLAGYPPLGAMPTITSPVWNWVDLTVGLLLVGVSEELVFRGFMYAFIRRYTDSQLAIVVISSIAFGFIHWSQGLHAVLITALVGAVFMLAYLRTRSLPAIMLAHFAIDFIDFADVIPKSIFKLI